MLTLICSLKEYSSSVAMSPNRLHCSVSFWTHCMYLITHHSPSPFNPEAQIRRYSRDHTDTPFIDMTSVTAQGSSASSQTANCARGRVPRMTQSIWLHPFPTHPVSRSSLSFTEPFFQPVQVKREISYRLSPKDVCCACSSLRIPPCVFLFFKSKKKRESRQPSRRIYTALRWLMSGWGWKPVYGAENAGTGGKYISFDPELGVHAFFKETVVNFGPASCSRFPLQTCTKTCAIFFKMLMKHNSANDWTTVFSHLAFSQFKKHGAGCSKFWQVYVPFLDICNGFWKPRSSFLIGGLDIQPHSLCCLQSNIAMSCDSLLCRVTCQCKNKCFRWMFCETYLFSNHPKYQLTWAWNIFCVILIQN